VPYSEQVDSKVEKRVKELEDQVGTLSVLTTITLLLALLMVVLYILEMICSARANGKAASPQLPTAVVIQPKEEEDEKKEKDKLKREERDECRHNSNRHFPSKTKLLELDVKRPDKEKAGKEKLKEAEAKAQPVVSVPLGAPPPYAEARKDTVLAAGAPIPSTGAPLASEKKPKPESAGSSGTESTATALATLSPVSSKQRPPVPSSAISATQTPTTTAQSKTTAALSSAQGQPAQPPPLYQLKSTTAAPKTMPTQTSKSAAPSLPVPAKPPNIRTTKYSVVQPPGRKRKSPMTSPNQASSTIGRKTSGVPIERTLMSRSSSTRTGLSAPRSGPSKSTTSASGQTALQPTPGTDERKASPKPKGGYQAKHNTWV
ncbi:hypothetical protein TELCIR_12787, partial [Teladorsagia circumcincta]